VLIGVICGEFLLFPVCSGKELRKKAKDYFITKGIVTHTGLTTVTMFKVAVIFCSEKLTYRSKCT